MGILFGVGVGPGDYEDLTLKAIRVINQSDVIVVPCADKNESYAYRIVAKAIDKIDDKEIMCREFPMIRDEIELNKIHDEAYTRIKELLKDRNVAFLTIGDPTVYSTYSYIHDRAIADGIDARIVNGITSFTAVAARLGISLSQNKEEVHVIPASLVNDDFTLYPGTNVFMKSGRHLRVLVEFLGRKEQQYEIYGVSNCGLDNEKIYRGIEDFMNGHDNMSEQNYLTVVVVKEREKEHGN